MVKHGRDGWELIDYDWCLDTGVATLTYERTRIDTGEPQTKVIIKTQPAEPKHVGWYMRIA